MFIKTQRERLIIIHNARGVGWKTIHKMWLHDPSFAKIVEMTIPQLVSCFQMKEHFAHLFYQDIHNTSYENLLYYYNSKNTKILTLFDTNYPILLKEIYDPPWVLYCKGNLQLFESQNMLSVVGSRAPSNYGISCMNFLLPDLIDDGWIIVSGLAYGVDIHAHKLTVDREGQTIAVLGSGLDHIYPTKNKKIADEIAFNHLLVSEYPNRQKPQKWQFPFRNRIISGLSKGTIVIEAKERSGSFITADQALQQGREIFAVPGSIFEPNSEGTNSLIQLGAKLVRTAQDITDEFEFSKQNYL